MNVGLKSDSEMKQVYAKEYEAYLNKEKHLALMVRDRVEKYGDSKVAVRHKPNGEWISYTWKEFGDMIDACSMGLIEYGVKKDGMVGMFLANRAEWSIIDLAAHSIRAASVPVYATNTAKETEYIINDAEIAILFVGDQDQYNKAIEVKKTSKYLKKIIVVDKTVQFEASDSVISFTDFLEMGKNSGNNEMLKKNLESADSDDLATLIYTSGTTGEPKGVMLTHQNFLAMLFGAGYYQHLKEDDVSLAFLPLSHVFERAWTYHVLQCGSENHYCHDTKAILDFLQESKPMYMTSVPRMWEKVHATIMEGLTDASPLKVKLFNWALRIGGIVGHKKKNGENLPLLLKIKHGLAYKLVIHKIMDLFGGRVKMFNCGGSAFSGEIAEFFFNAGVLLLQGYGMTECFVISMANNNKNKFGTCGVAVPLMEVRISDEGEIQAKGPSMMKGYFNKPELTKEMYTPDGWIKTGDVGILDEEGFITITDRIKDLMKTSGGKYIAPQKIETLLKEDLYFEQVAVIGDRRKYVSALIVPSFESLENYAKKNNIEYSTVNDLVKNPDIIDFYSKRINERTKDLGQVEKVKKFTLLSHEFTQENREITPTQKIRRKVINERYNELIEGMYQE